MDRFHRIADAFAQVQKQACLLLETIDGAAFFSNDAWQKEIGTGITRVIAHGSKIEKGAINFSKVSGPVTPSMEATTGISEGTFSATGVSSIFHPKNPLAPIIHMNIRYFELSNGKAWFGGGIDLTPHYIDLDEVRNFHQELKRVCDTFDASWYPDFKQQADNYFFIQHRNESRGVGGIFYDHLMADERSWEKLFDFSVDLGTLYPELYAGILIKKGNLPYSPGQLLWQKHRRSRYVEFNLMYDRGTQFGLQSNGNVESILVSMPPDAQWSYNYSPEPGSEEEKTMNFLKKGINWLEI
ncbi:MAG: oxygen-dependent coproporphyrinogen oxidase [Bacteroidetes bacterium HGW-Bacteroidetes-4]|jgi:coproporphyrinogen III oxidase|nr:MAG: oxygen-dependent coproporphyrinogen oxidase [Bacteroidetes bacterium HGW-Bacteroidetes-4]